MNVPRQSRGCKAYNEGQETNREHNSRGLSSPADY